MRMIRAGLMLIAATGAGAQAPRADDAALHAADAATTASLNAAIQRNNDAIAQRNHAVQDAYAEDLARFREAARANDRARADALAAADAYRASRAGYEAELAEWRNHRTPPPPAPRPAKATPHAPDPCDGAMTTGTRIRRPGCR